MKKMKFYVCPQCGNILWASGEGEVFCCEKMLEPLKAQEEDENHSIKAEVIENDYYVTIDHEMRKEHHFIFGAYATYDKVIIVRLYPEQAAEFRVPRLGKGDIYIYCNNHGLYKKIYNDINCHIS